MLAAPPRAAGPLDRFLRLRRSGAGAAGGGAGEVIVIDEDEDEDGGVILRRAAPELIDLGEDDEHENENEDDGTGEGEGTGAGVAADVVDLTGSPPAPPGALPAPRARKSGGSAGTLEGFLRR